MSNYKPQVGDHVRVVLEGEVTSTPNYVNDFRLGGEGDPYTWIQPGSRHVVSIEKIEPPVEVFGPGDVVRDRAAGTTYTIAHGGYVSHALKRFFEWAPRGYIKPGSFTSKHYERVTLS